MEYLRKLIHKFLEQGQFTPLRYYLQLSVLVSWLHSMDLHLVLILLMIFVVGLCPASALSHQFHKMSTSFVQKDTFSHSKVSSFRSVMCLFIFALQGNERLNKSCLLLSLIFLFSLHPYEVCSTSQGMKEAQQLPSLKDGAFYSVFHLGLSHLLESWFKRYSKSPRKLQWNSGTLCCYKIVFKNKKHTQTSDL